MTSPHRPREHPTGFRISGILLCALLAACGGGGGGGGGSPGPAPPSDTVPPTVVSTIPASFEAGVAVTTPIRAVFSEPVDPGSITSAAVSVTRSGLPVTGTLGCNATYTVTVTAGIRDLAGNPMASPYAWQFTTAPLPAAGPLRGILTASGGMTLSYDGPTNTLTLLPQSPFPLDGVSVRAIVPVADNNTETAWEAAVSTDGWGTFSVPATVSGKILLVAERNFPSGATRRILGVGKLYFTGAPAEIEIPVEDVTPSAAEVRLDRFCERCHPQVQTLPGQIPRDVHASGIVPVAANNPTGNFDDFGRVTCESCHTSHLPTGVLYFALAPYETGELCLRCH